MLGRLFVSEVSVLALSGACGRSKEGARDLGSGPVFWRSYCLGIDGDRRKQTRDSTYAL